METFNLNVQNLRNDDRYLQLSAVGRLLFSHVAVAFDPNWGHAEFTLSGLVAQAFPVEQAAADEGDPEAEGWIAEAKVQLRRAIDLGLFMVEDTPHGRVIAYRQWERYNSGRNKRGAPRYPMGPAIAGTRDWSRIAPGCEAALAKWRDENGLGNSAESGGDGSGGVPGKFPESSCSRARLGLGPGAMGHGPGAEGPPACAREAVAAVEVPAAAAHTPRRSWSDCSHESPDGLLDVPTLAREVAEVACHVERHKTLWLEGLERAIREIPEPHRTAANVRRVAHKCAMHAAEREQTPSVRHVVEWLGREHWEQPARASPSGNGRRRQTDPSPPEAFAEPQTGAGFLASFAKTGGA